MEQSHVTCAREQLFGLSGIARSICSWTLLHEDDAIVLRRPIVDNLLYLQSHGCQLFDHHFLCNAVSTSILRDSFYRPQIGARWEIDDCQMSPRLERAHQISIKLLRLCEMVIYMAQENRVAATRRKLCVVRRSLHNDHVFKLAFRDFRSENLQFSLVNFSRINPARRPNLLSGREAVGSVTSANVCPNCPGLPLRHLRQPSYLLALVAVCSKG